MIESNGGTLTHFGGVFEFLIKVVKNGEDPVGNSGESRTQR